MKKITTIMCALPEEFNAIKQVFQFSSIKQNNTHKDIWHAEVNGQEFLIGMSNIGCINASIMASKLCLLYKPTSILFCGIAGGICNTLTVGDVVIPNSAFYVESTSHECFADNWAAPNPDLDLHSKNIDTKSLNLNGYHIFQATVATSDVFPAPTKSLDTCHTKNAIIIDMETYPAALVAQQFNVPFYCVRSVSNAIESEEIPKNALLLAAFNAAIISKQIIAKINNESVTL